MRAPEVGRAIEEADPRPEDAFHVAEYTSFEWDKVVVVGPYTPSSEVVRMAGGPVPDEVAGRLENDDHHNMLIFMHRDRMTAWTLVERSSNVDFWKVVDQAYTPSEAVWTVGPRGELEPHAPE